MPPNFPGPQLMEPISAIFPIFFGLIAVCMVVVVVTSLVKTVSQASYNNSQPVRNEPAKVVAKRSRTTGSTFNNSNGTGPSITTASTVSTFYYATFETEDSARKEYLIPSAEYGMLAEGDVGQITYQGNRYLGFQRVS